MLTLIWDNSLPILFWYSVTLSPLHYSQNLHYMMLYTDSYIWQVPLQLKEHRRGTMESMSVLQKMKLVLHILQLLCFMLKVRFMSPKKYFLISLLILKFENLLTDN